MKCPSCGAENPEYAVYCGKCAGSIKESSKSTKEPIQSSDSPEISGSPTQMAHLIKNRFLRACVLISGILLAITGVLFSIVGVYGIAGGSRIVFYVNDRVVSAGEGGEIFLAAGIVFLFAGYGLRYVYYKEKPAVA